MSNQLDLSAIEARCAAATDGPWGLRRYDANYPGDRYEVVVELRGAEWTLEQRRANAELMAHARTDIPALCAEVRRKARDATDLCLWLKVALEIIQTELPEYVGDGGFVTDTEVEFNPMYDRYVRQVAKQEVPDAEAEVRRLEADNERMRRGVAAIGNLPKGYEDKIWDGCANLLAGREWSEGE